MPRERTGAAMPETLCTFRVHGQRFGIGVERVQEVLRAQELSPVPHAPRAVAGLMNLRGQIVLAVELRERLGLPPREMGAPSMYVVLREEEGPIALVVDEIGDVLAAQEAAFELAPETLPIEARAMIVGAYKLPKELVLKLRPEAVTALSVA